MARAWMGKVYVYFITIREGNRCDCEMNAARFKGGKTKKKPKQNPLMP